MRTNWLKQRLAHPWGSEEGSERRREVVAESPDSEARVARVR